MGNIVPSAGLARKLVEGLPSVDVGVIFDPGNMICEGYVDWDMSLDVLGEYLAHVHVKNSMWIKKDTSWQFTWATKDEGMVNWSEVISTLKRHGYKGYLSVEDFSDVKPVDKLCNWLNFFKSIL